MDRRNVVNLYLYMRGTMFCFLLASSGIANLSYTDLMYAQRQNTMRYSEIVMVRIDIGNFNSFWSVAALVFDVNLKIKGRNAF